MKYDISQAKIARYIELKALAKEFDALSSELKDLLISEKVQIQPGKLSIGLKIKERPNVAWKAEFVKVACEKMAEEISANAPLTTVKEIVIIDRNNPGGS